MKKTIYLICIFAVTFSIAKAQTFKLDECSINTQRGNSLSASAIFNTAGINLNKYDWKNPTVNCHINMTDSYAKKSKGKKIGGMVLASVGGVFAIGSATMFASYQNDFGAGFLVPALLCGGGSVPLFLFSKKDKKKMNYHLNQVSEYYRTNSMF